MSKSKPAGAVAFKHQPDTSVPLAKNAVTVLERRYLTKDETGQVIETPDGLPFIGDTAEHQFAGTGYSGNGMTFGTLTGMMAADRVMGRKNPWSALFDPGRKTHGGVWDDLRQTRDYRA